MIAPQSEYEARYDRDMQIRDLAETFWTQWGKNKVQRCRNLRAYDQLKECGFDEEPTFDEYGWLSNQKYIKPSEKIILWSSGELENYVVCAQLPNGKWISGINYMLSLSGCCSGLSIWNHQYDTRIDAISAPLRSLLERLKKENSAKDREHIADVMKALDDIRQLSLF